MTSREIFQARLHLEHAQAKMAWDKAKLMSQLADVEKSQADLDAQEKELDYLEAQNKLTRPKRVK